MYGAHNGPERTAARTNCRGKWNSRLVIREFKDFRVNRRFTKNGGSCGFTVIDDLRPFIPWKSRRTDAAPFPTDGRGPAVLPAPSLFTGRKAFRRFCTCSTTRIFGPSCRTFYPPASPESKGVHRNALVERASRPWPSRLFVPLPDPDRLPN